MKERKKYRKVCTSKNDTGLSRVSMKLISVSIILKERMKSERMKKRENAETNFKNEFIV